MLVIGRKAWVLWMFLKKFLKLLEDGVVRKKVVYSLFEGSFKLEESCVQSCKRRAAAFACLILQSLVVSICE